MCFARVQKRHSNLDRSDASPNRMKKQNRPAKVGFNDLFCASTIFQILDSQRNLGLVFFPISYCTIIRNFSKL